MFFASWAAQAVALPPALVAKDYMYGIANPDNHCTTKLLVWQFCEQFGDKTPSVDIARWVVKKGGCGCQLSTMRTYRSEWRSMKRAMEKMVNNYQPPSMMKLH